MQSRQALGIAFVVLRVKLQDELQVVGSLSGSLDSISLPRNISPSMDSNQPDMLLILEIRGWPISGLEWLCYGLLFGGTSRGLRGWELQVSG